MKRKGSRKRGLTLIQVSIYCLLIIASVNYFNNNVRINNLKAEQAAKEQELKRINSELNDMRELIAKSKTYEFIEIVARNDLGMIKPNELQIIDKNKKNIFDN